MREISNTDNVIDSRDVIARIEELAQQARDYANDEEGAEPLSDEEDAEMSSLSDFATQGANSTDDWDHGATLIRYSYFTEYIRDYVQEMSSDALSTLPDYVMIDWEATADQLHSHYSSVEFDGVTYYVR